MSKSDKLIVNNLRKVEKCHALLVSQMQNHRCMAPVLLTCSYKSGSTRVLTPIQPGVPVGSSCSRVFYSSFPGSPTGYYRTECSSDSTFSLDDVFVGEGNTIDYFGIIYPGP